MELLEGENLASFNKEESLLAPEEVVRFISKICHALDFAHSHNVIHRDIKPANLVYTRERAIKITDFGIAMPVHANKTSELQVIGTPSYMSPEQTKGLKLTRHTDFFSLGVVLFELLTGRRPFRGRTLYELMDNIRYAPVPSALKFKPELPPGIDVVIRRALEKEPEVRYRTGKEFSWELEQAMKGKRIPERDIKAGKKADLIKSVEFFRGFSRQQVEAVARLGTFIRYDEGQVMVREGNVDTSFFILLTGAVRVIKNNKRIADLPKGACFGEMGALTGAPRTAHVLARKRSLVLKLDLKVVERQDKELKLKFYEVFVPTLVERLEQTTSRLSQQDETTNSSI
jgi:eukaryotic-like serine/threonine-protein kinase